jgi:HlyD family secretion protein
LFRRRSQTGEHALKVKKKLKRRTIWISTSILAIVAAVAIGSFVMRQGANADADLEPGQIVTAFVGSLSAEASASGQLVPDREATLSFAAPGRVEQVFVETGSHVRAGDVLVQLETDALKRGVRTAEQTLAIQSANLAELRKGTSKEDIASASAAVESAETQLNDLLAGPRDRDRVSAEAAVFSAQAQLDDLLAGPSDKELAQAQAALDSAVALEKAEAKRYAALDAQTLVARQQLDIAAVSLENARYFYDALKNDWQHKDYADHSPEAQTLKDAQTAYDIALARYQLNAANLNDSAYRGAQAQVAQARAGLNTLTGDRTVEIAGAREQLAQAEASLTALMEEKTTQIAAARAQLTQAQASLASALDGASAERLAMAEAQVAQARISLANARARLDKAALLAPFDGAVTAVHVALGEWAAGPVVEMVDTDSLEVVLDVDEVDIGQIATGMQTVVTLDAWSDEELRGEVVAIAPRGSAQSEIVTYQVHISLEAGVLPVRTGMTANAELITAERNGVLLVSNRAITADRSADKYYVHRVEGDDVTEVEVTIGLRDGNYTEVTSGLQEGEQVIIDYQQGGLTFGPGQGGPMGH